ncbi:MAG: NUDIX hydrolase [Terriglobia bacterium]
MTHSAREYPERPIVGVGGVVVRAGAVLLVERASEPLKGQWSLPGGAVELGETLVEAVQRELREETGLEVKVLDIVEVFERISPPVEAAARGRPRYHYVLIDYLCEPVSGTARAGSDVSAVAWARPEELARYQLTAKATAVIQKALQLYAARR